MNPHKPCYRTTNWPECNRSLVETTMGRFKLLGERLTARQPERQVAEVHVRCVILNTFNRLGLPVTVAHA